MSTAELRISPDFVGEKISTGPAPWDEWEEEPTVEEPEARYAEGQPRKKGKFSYVVGDPVDSATAMNALMKGGRANVTPEGLKELCDSWPGDSTDKVNLVGHLFCNGRMVTGDKGLPFKRKDMPQLDGDRREQYLRHAESQGIKVTRGVSVDPRTLTPGQDEVSMRSTSKLFRVREQGGYDDTNHVVVTSDGRVLDGNHRWSSAALAAQDGYPNTRLTVDIIDLPASMAIPHAKRWTDVQGIKGKELGQDHVWSTKAT